MKAPSLLAAFVVCTTSKPPCCDAFSSSSAVLRSSARSRQDHRAHSSSSSDKALETRGRSRRCSSLLDAGRGGGDEVGSSGISGNSDRRDFLRAAAAIAGCSATIFGGSGVALGVGIQPGERTTDPPNALLLVPALRAKLASEHLLTLLKDPAKWDEARAALQAPPLAPADFRACFRTYSDADPEQHLAFDLYRIQAQGALKAVSELLAYLASEKTKGAEIVPEDVEDLDDAGRSVLQGIDDFLRLAPAEDVLMVERNTRDQARTAAARPASPAGQQLEGAVVGEGAFVAGARVAR